MRKPSVVRRAARCCALGILCAGTAMAGDPGRCYSAELRATIVLPDGSERPPGRLRVCTTARYSPVETLHRLDWNGVPAGLFRGAAREVDVARGSPSGPVIVLSRLPGGSRWVLEGYAEIEHGHARTYALGARGRVTSRWQLARWFEAGDAETSSWVLVAAADR